MATGKAYAVNQNLRKFFRDVIGSDSILLYYKALPDRIHLVGEFFESGKIRLVDWPARSPYIKSIERVWEVPGRITANRL